MSTKKKQGAPGTQSTVISGATPILPAIVQNNNQRKRANTQVTKSASNNPTTMEVKSTRNSGAKQTSSEDKAKLKAKLEEKVAEIIEANVNTQIAQVKSIAPTTIIETLPEVKFDRTLTSLSSEIAPTPTKGHEGDTCYDLVAVSMSHRDNYVEYELGIKTEIPAGIWGDVRARSSISNYDLVLCNGTGVIDEPYRGRWCARFKVVRHVSSKPGVVGVLTRMWQSIKHTFTSPRIYKVGDKVAQVYFPVRGDVNWVEAPINLNTKRGVGGFGSTDSNVTNKLDGRTEHSKSGVGVTEAGADVSILHIKPIE